MANIALSMATAALPYVVKGVAGWVNKSAQTWGPAVVANNTIETAAIAGSKLFGDHYILGKIGGAAGRAFGWASAPFVAQSDPIQAGLGLGGQIIAGGAGALVHVIGGYALNKLAGTKPEESTSQQLLNQQQLLQNQLQIETLQKMQEQLNAGKKTSHVVIDHDQLEKLAAELKMDITELRAKIAIN